MVKMTSREQSPQDPYSPPPPQGAQTHLGIEVQIRGFYRGVRVQEPGHEEVIPGTQKPLLLQQGSFFSQHDLTREVLSLRSGGDFPVMLLTSTGASGLKALAFPQSQ